MISTLNERLHRQWQGAYSWVDGGAQNNPGGGAVVADTGALTAGAYLFAVQSWTDTAALLNLQHMDAANSVVLHQVNRAVAGNGNDDCIFGSKVHLAVNERFRVIMGAGITGNLRVSIFYVEVPDTTSS